MDIYRYPANSGNRGNCGRLNLWQFATASASILACLAVTVLLVPDTSAREIHVAKTGNDSHAGNPESPYLTIGKAAVVAQPGDTITVHAGTYREWVKPARGGRDENSRVTYRAAAGEEVFIKGSERITSWVQQENGVWMVELPNRFFGDYNPYALNISGGWLLYGQWLHRGDVYLDGEAFAGAKDPGGREAAAANLVLPGKREQHHHLGQLRQGESQCTTRRDQRPRKRLHAGRKRPRITLR